MGEPEKGRTPVDDVLKQFDARKELLTRFCERTKSLLEEILQDAGIRCQSVQARVKSSKKVREKYTDSRKDYKQLDDITDLAALRVITYYEDEVDKVADVIEREFEIDRDNSIDKRATEADRFGYYALNYVCRHLDRRRTDVEYRKFGKPVSKSKSPPYCATHGPKFSTIGMTSEMHSQTLLSDAFPGWRHYWRSLNPSSWN